MTSLGIFITAFNLAFLASGEPLVSFPFNSQLPLAARIDEPYSYEFSRYTFKSDSKISYSLSDAPSWLSLDGESRRLYGTPKDAAIPSGEVVGQSFEILADDGSGTASLNATLVVSRNDAPKVKIPISDQIEGFGDFSAPSSLISYPSTEFKYTFDPDTFDFNSDGINYYATSDDSSPLPAWMKFDAQSLTFSGKTPPFESLIQPPQTFGFRLVASDIVGFSAVSVSFSIIVGSHKLTTDNPIVELNATRGKEFSYDGLASGIKVDNKAASPSNVNVSADDMPKWLSLDAETWKLKGTPGNDDRSTNITLRFRDEHADTLDIIGVVNVASRLFRSTFDDISVRAGSDFDLNLEEHFWNPEDISLGISTSPEKDWLKLEGFELTGKIPESEKGNFELSITASSKSSDIKETGPMTVKIIAATAAATASTATNTATKTSVSETSSNPTETSTSDKTSSSGSRGLSTGELLLATIIPTMAVILLLMLLACCLLRRRRARRTYLSTKFRNKISGPVLDSLQVNDSDAAVQQVHTTTDVGKVEQQMHHPGKQGYAEVASQVSSQSSRSLDSVETPQLPSGLVAEGARTRNMSFPTTEGRQSWVTVDGTATATNRRSVSSLRSQQSDTTFSESTHHLIPPPGFLSDSGSGSFRSRLDLAIPSLEDLSSLQNNAIWRRAQLRQMQRSSDFYSSASGSSLGFSSSHLHLSSPRLMTGAFGRKSSVSASGSRPSVRDRSSIINEEEEGEAVPEVQRPGAARLSSQQWLSQRPSRSWTDTTFNRSRSFITDPSFGSQENWKVISTGGPNDHDTNGMSYRELVDEAPFHPSRQSETVSEGRDGAQPGERNSLILMSPSKWGDRCLSARASSNALGLSNSRFSLLSGELLSKAGSKMSRLGQTTSMDWRREDSVKPSEGSFKAFL